MCLVRNFLFALYTKKVDYLPRLPLSIPIKVRMLEALTAIPTCADILPVYPRMPLYLIE